MSLSAIAPRTVFPDGFPRGGVSVRGASTVVQYTGNVFYVSSVFSGNFTLNSGSRGTEFNPYPTLTQALEACRGEAGNRIYLMPGHAETISAAGGITIDVDGVEIVGLGQGSEAATFTFGTSTAASMLISANNVTLQNVIGVAAIDGLINPFNITGDGFGYEITWNDASSTVEAARAMLCTGVNGLTGQLNYNGFTAGNAVVNAIRLVNCADVDIDVNTYGICSTAWVQFLTTASTNVNITGTMYTQGITNLSRDVVDTVTGSTGFAQIIDASAGVSASGGSATSWVLSSDDISSIATAVADIQTDIGNPSAAGTSLDGEIRTGFNSSAITPNQNGSVMEMQKFLIANLAPDLQGFSFGGVCDSGMTPSTTSIVSATLAGYGDGFFANKYYLQVLLDGVTPGAAPEQQVQQITAYTSSTGTFTTNAFTVTVKPNSKIFVMHESIATIGRNDNNNAIDTSLVVDNATGSILERVNYVQTVVGNAAVTLNTIQNTTNTINTNVGDPSADTLTTITAKLGNMAVPLSSTQTSIATINTNVNSTLAFVGNGSGTQMAVNKGIADALGTTGSAINDSAVSIAGMIGPNNANNAFASNNVGPDADGSLMERSEYQQVQLATLQTNVGDASGDTLTSANAKLGNLPVTVSAILGNPTGDTLTSISAKLGNPATAIGTLTSTVNTNLGDPSGDFLTSITAKMGNLPVTLSAILGNPTGDMLNNFTAKIGDSATTLVAFLSAIQTAVGIAPSATSVTGAIGTEFWVKKTLTSSAITQVAQDLTVVSSGGELAILNILCKTDSTGLAGGTLFNVSSTNTKGQALMFSKTVATMGANTTNDFASISYPNTVLESGAKLQYAMTAADGTGAGTVDVYVRFKRLSAGATVAAA